MNYNIILLNIMTLSLEYVNELRHQLLCNVKYTDKEIRTMTYNASRKAELIGIMNDHITLLHKLDNPNDLLVDSTK